MDEEKVKKSKAVPLLTALAAVLLIAVIVLTACFSQQRKEARETQTQLMAEKDSIANNLLNLMVDYEEMETNNETLNQKLAEEQANAQKLYDELQSVKRVSYSKIKEYQKELGTLRSIMKDMLHDIDSLNTMNKELIAENIKVKAEIATTKETVKSLEEQTEELNSQVAKGSVIRARNVVAMGVNDKGNEVTRAKRVKKIRTCLTISENAIAKAGTKTVYMRVIGPDEFVLAKSEADLFDYQGNKIVFSASREVDYQNADVDVCVYYDNNGELLKGKYLVNIHLEGEIIGTAEFVLK